MTTYHYTRKDRATPEFWADLRLRALEYVPPSRTEALAAAAVRVIEDARRKWRLGIAYSGGKDGLVAYDLARRAGVTVGVMSISDLHYPAWREYALPRVPSGIEVVESDVTWGYIYDHPYLMIPHPISALYRFWSLTHWKAQRDFIADRGLDGLITGRRVEDGNTCGRRGLHYTARQEGGRTVYALNPLRSWTHADVLAYLHRSGIELPPWYDLPHGWEDGPIACIEEFSAHHARFKDDPAGFRLRALARVHAKHPPFAARLSGMLKERGMLA